MKPLIAEDSLLYKKRLVRELNAHPDGSFYASIGGFLYKCNRARMRAGSIEVHCPIVIPRWSVPLNQIFTDPYGRQIVASRSPR